ncbi:peptidoglycan-binding domain-containing protein [Flavivirga rizhaonensis]|uniref:Peptidoglycan-binding protein n=1 Tax=Flavivirga rizhaonensis TaxID=2559571 RepID=A0A4S1DZP1_9FLAO|nr:peptidoglycan-binding protein [Flavivirga rizhaonensis]TGV03639.1 peptidoglycan-binding protein [Flavivirga rizhaonensis]
MKTTTQNPQSFFVKNKDLIIVGGTIVVIVGAGLTWYYLKKKKDTTSDNVISDPITLSGTTASKYTKQQLSRTGISTKPKYSNSGYPIKYGSQHRDVIILQRYLKIYKENLGKTGTNKDGVDGKFGALTLKAAKKRLGKSVFTENDINGMRKATKTIKR